MARHWTLSLKVMGLNFEELRQGWWTLDYKLEELRLKKTRS
jgi:hypothetical protein